MKIRIEATLGVLALAAVFSFTSSAAAGGIERFCGTQGEVVERWVNPVAVPWAYGSGPTGHYGAPGFPSTGCSMFAGMIDSRRPMLQSLYNAIAKWNSASLSPQVPRVSGFTFNTPGTAVSMQSNLVFPGGYYMPLAWWNPLRPTGRDFVNTITLWDGEESFTNMGGPATLAVTGVWADLANGTILEVDIALNAFAPVLVPGRANWCFVEDNAALGVTLGTKQAFGPNTPFTDPLIGYADLEGVLTHELGHFAGLGHSLVDATDAAGTQTRFPTMFAIAQNEPYQATISVPTSVSSVCGFAPQATNASLTALQGILGKSARTLEVDDLFAIAEGYPRQANDAYWTQTGSISGVVTNPQNVIVRGVSVVAVSATQPDVVRVGTLTHGGGAYTITGLLPGAYFVKVEQVDTGYTGAYFREGDVPNYVQSPGNLGCVNPLPVMSSEWFDAQESAIETSDANATAVNVVAAATAQANIVLNSTPYPQLVVKLSSELLRSPRGVRISAGNTVDFFATGLPVGGVAVLMLDLKRTMMPFGSQLSEVYPLLSYAALAGSNGEAQFTLPVPASFSRANLFAQVAFMDAVGNVSLTTSVNLWITGP